MRIRLELAALAALFVLPLARAGPDCGVVDVTGAIVGAGIAPSRGTLTAGPCLPTGLIPDLPPIAGIGPMGTMDGSLPDFPGGGSGGDGVFVATTDTTLPGGVYEHTTYFVDSDVTVAYTGPVEIRTTGNMTLNGTVKTMADSAPIKVRCAGFLEMEGGPGARADLLTEGADGAIDVMAGEDFFAGPAAEIRAADGAVSLSAHGRSAGTGAIDLDPGGIVTNAGDLTVQARGGISVVAGSLSTESGAVLVRSFESYVQIDNGAAIETFSGPLLDVQAATRVEIWLDSRITTSTTPIRVVAFGDALEIDGASITSGAGEIDLRARRFLGLASASVGSTSGRIAATCFEGDLEIENPLNTGAISSVGSVGGDLDLRAQGNVTVNGMSRVHSWTGRTDVRAGSDFVLTDRAAVGSDLISVGPVDIRATEAIDVTSTPSLGGYIVGSAVAISAGGAGIDIDLPRVRSTEGPLTILTEGPMRLDGEFRAFGDLRVTSIRDSVEIRGETLRTDDRTAGTSGSILVDSWAGEDGRIDALGATVVSGNSPDASGDVTLGVHSENLGPSVADEGFLLPKVVKLRLDPAAPERSRLRATGTLDLGTGDVDLTAASTLVVGDLTLDVPGLTASRSGRKLVYVAEGVGLVVRPDRSGSSKARFRLILEGDFGDALPADGDARLRFSGAGFDGACSCSLRGGRFRLGRTPGRLGAPRLYVTKAKATLGGDWSDDLDLTLGFDSRDLPTEGFEVVLRVGGSLDVTIPADRLTRTAHGYSFRGDIDGITRVRLDFQRETMRVKGRDVDLGTFAEGANAVAVQLVIGEVDRSVRIRMVRQGTKLTY